MLLESIASRDTAVSTTELREETSIPAATLTRLLGSLCEAGYIRKMKHGRYSAGPRLIGLATTVMEHSAATPFGPLLHSLCRITGQNSEVYAITPQGPVFLRTVAGDSDIRITMPPGHVVKGVYRHPAGAFFFHRYPRALHCRRKELTDKGASIDNQEQRIAQAARERFIVDRGGSRPELARAAVPVSDGTFCVCVSGFVSDFPQANDSELRRLMHQELERFAYDVTAGLPAEHRTNKKSPTGSRPQRRP